MTGYRAEDLTNGFLPLAAFEHLQVTEMAVVDLEGTAAVATVDHLQTGTRPRDGLLLVRLHGEPLAVIHVEEAIGELSSEGLSALLWRHAADAMAEHAGRYGCVGAGELPGLLFAGRVPSGDRCAGARFANSGASASVIVPTGGRPHQLRRCLEALLALERTNLDVLVVDNRPEDCETRDLVDAVAAEDGRVRYIPESRPGSSVARNRGIAETSADFVAFTDDDVVVDAHWLDWLLSPFAAPEVTVVTGMVLPLELRTEAQKRFEQYAGFSKGVTGQAYDLHAARADERILYPYWGGVFGSGNSMAFRRAEFAAAGGFDTALGAGSLALAGADIEAFSAAILRGGRLVYEPRALCWHEHRREEDALQRQLYNYGVGFTAILAKHLLHDPRFLGALGRAVPVGLRRRRAGSAGRSAAALPRDYERVVQRGMLRGPWLYGKSRRWARRLRLDAVIHEPQTGSAVGSAARGG